LCQKLQCQTVTREKLEKTLSKQKNHLNKMLMKETLGVDFANVLRAAFTHVDPESAKRH